MSDYLLSDEAKEVAFSTLTYWCTKYKIFWSNHYEVLKFLNNRQVFNPQLSLRFLIILLYVVYTQKRTLKIYNMHQRPLWLRI